MRIFISVLILIFSFQSFSKSEEINEYELLGMRIGDSALDYFSQKQINEFQFGFESKLFAYVNIPKNKLENFDDGFILIKPKDKNFLIHSIVVRLYFNDNIKECYNEQNKRIKEASSIFNNVKQTDKDTYEYTADKSGKSMVTTINLKLEEGSLFHTGCYNMDKEYLKQNDFFPETALLSMSLASIEYTDFQMNR